MQNQWEHYQIMDGSAIAVVFRNKGKEQIWLCPFCGDAHRHAVGHSDYPSRTHCKNNSHFEQVVAPDGTIMRQIHGYIIREV